MLSKYRHCFVANILELGRASSVEMQIALTTSEPIACRPYRVAYSQRATMQRIVQDLLDYDIIRPSASSFVSPALLVKKKDGEDQMVVDYPRLNEKTVKDRYPLLIIEDLLQQLKGS